MQSQDLGIKIPVVYRSEKEDWIQSMVAAGFGVTFLPEFSVVTPGVVSRPLIKPGRPQLVTRSRDLHSGGTNASVAPCSLAKRRVAARTDRNLALPCGGQDRDQCRQRNINLKVLERLI